MRTTLLIALLALLWGCAPQRPAEDLSDLYYGTYEDILPSASVSTYEDLVALPNDMMIRTYEDIATLTQGASIGDTTYYTPKVDPTPDMPYCPHDHGGGPFYPRVVPRTQTAMVIVSPATDNDMTVWVVFRCADGHLFTLGNPDEE